ANDLSRSVWDRAVPKPLCSRASQSAHALHVGGISCAGATAAAGVVSAFSFPLSIGAGQSWDFPCGLRRRGHSGRFAETSAARLVARAGGAVVFPAANRARPGAVRRPVEPCSSARGGAGETGGPGPPARTQRGALLLGQRERQPPGFFAQPDG